MAIVDRDDLSMTVTWLDRISGTFNIRVVLLASYPLDAIVSAYFLFSFSSDPFSLLLDPFLIVFIRSK